MSQEFMLEYAVLEREVVRKLRERDQQEQHGEAFKESADDRKHA